MKNRYIYIVVVHAFAVLICSPFYSFSQSAKELKDTFYLMKADEKRELFYYSHFEGGIKISLYKDSIFDYEAVFNGSLYAFSSGRWKVEGGLIFLESNKKTYDAVFLRSKRRRSKGVYKFVDITDYYFIKQTFVGHRSILIRIKR